MANRIAMTREGYRKLQGEMKDLEGKVPALRKAIQTAREHGDLSENAEYHAAKEALAGLEGKIAQVKAKLAAADLIDDSKLPEGIATIGSRVTLVDMEAGDEEEYHLVGAGEENFLEGKILTTSPLGQALLRREEGEEFEFDTPNGLKIKYRVVKLDR
ncbi:MAG: transcription elongation factor GreA [Planctomycetes bacterium]|nr:transcription elongation factor GreA [Planctomycetota bacterium]